MRPLSSLASSLLRPPSATGRDWQDHAHLYLLRLACVLCALLIPAFGVLYQAADADTADALWVHLLTAGLGIGVLVATYVSAWVRPRASQILLCSCFGSSEEHTSELESREN